MPSSEKKIIDAKIYLVIKNKLGHTNAANDFKALNLFLKGLSSESIILPKKSIIIETVKEKFNLNNQRYLD